MDDSHFDGVNITFHAYSVPKEKYKTRAFKYLHKQSEYAEPIVMELLVTFFIVCPK